MMSKEMLVNAYKDKNVYITGITGFKGSWLALMLHHLGANVSGMGLAPEEGESIFMQARVDEIADVIIEDITAPADETKFIKHFSSSRPDYVFHLAAQPIVSLGYLDPYETFNTNIMGTVILHEMIRGYRDASNKDKKLSVINVTTDKVYKESDRAMKEDDELKGYDPYSLSKSFSDMITECYYNIFKDDNTFMSTARAGNVIGGGDMAPNRIIPDIVRAAMVDGTVGIRNPQSVRPYQHVFDALNAYLIIGALQKDNSEIQGPWNVGPDAEQTMTTRELAGRMKEHMTFDWKHTGESIGHENDYLVLDNTKIKNIGWKPAYKDNAMVVKSVADWYNSYIQGNDMQTFTLKQIEEAFDLYENS